MSPTKFAFSLTPDGPTVTDAFAVGGDVTLPQDLSGPDGAAWGAEVFGAQAIPLLQSQLNSQVSGGFTPDRILLTTAGAATNTNAPMLQFQGTQSVVYEGSRFSAGLGAQNGNDAKYLTVDRAGRFSFLDATNGQSTITATVSWGDTNVDVEDIGAVGPGVVRTQSMHRLGVGDPVSFKGLVNPTGKLVDGQTYYVREVLSPTAFEISDSLTGPLVPGTATGGKLEQQPWQAAGLSFSGTVQVTFQYDGTVVGG